MGSDRTPKLERLYCKGADIKQNEDWRSSVVLFPCSNSVCIRVRRNLIVGRLVRARGASHASIDTQPDELEGVRLVEPSEAAKTRHVGPAVPNAVRHVEAAIYGVSIL